MVSWVMTPCSDVAGYQRFGGPCCLHLQGENLELFSVHNCKAKSVNKPSIKLYHPGTSRYPRKSGRLPKIIIEDGIEVTCSTERGDEKYV
jgi:hypothetical protein